MGHLLQHYRAGGDPFHQGDTNVGLLALGYTLTDGAVFPWTGGGTLLQRRRLYPTTGPWTYCGFARPGETTIENMAGFGHAADEAFQYAARQVLGNGFVSPAIEPVRMDFDSGGNRITPPLPMFPTHVSATPLAGGTFAVVFSYDPFGQGAYPKDFQVFEGETAATIDWNTPLGTVSYVGQQARYEFTTGAFADGTDHVFGVRARNSGATAELNTYASASRRARAAAPAGAAVSALSMRRVSVAR